MSDTEIKYDIFWSGFKAHPMTKKYNLKVIESYEDNSIFKTGDNARKVLTPCNPDYIFLPDYITVRGNSKGKNYIMCKIRFAQEISSTEDEEMDFWNYLEKCKKEVVSSIQGNPKGLYKGEIEWDGANEGKAKPMINLLMYVRDVFDMDERKYYFNWLAHNADLYLRVFKEYYDKYKDDKEKQTL